MYLIDTNVISETIRKAPNESVMTWLSQIDIFKVYISVITIGEIRKGIEKLELENKKQKLIQWLEEDLLEKFEGRIVSIDPKVADKWGYICSKDDIPAIDALIAASALVYNLKLVTRNTKDFDKISGLEIINPWLL